MRVRSQEAMWNDLTTIRENSGRHVTWAPSFGAALLRTQPFDHLRIAYTFEEYNRKPTPSPEKV
jgi:hypothetical protein